MIYMIINFVNFITDIFGEYTYSVFMDSRHGCSIFLGIDSMIWGKIEKWVI